MTKTNRKRGGPSIFPQVSPDHPIYKTGYTLLKPIYRREEELPSEEAVFSPEGSDNTVEDQENSDSTD